MAEAADVELVSFIPNDGNYEESGMAKSISVASRGVLLSASQIEGETAYDFNGFRLSQGELASLKAPSSLFVFSGENVIRIRALQLVRSRLFQNFILLCIFVNSVLLGMDWPASTRPQAFYAFLSYADLVFTVVFTLELVLKIVALGFVLHEGSFLRVGWNVMDLIIVVFSLVQLFFGQRALAGIRTVRVFRPLRSISRIPKLKQLVSGLLRGLPQVMNNFILFLFVIVLFALAGVQLYQDALSRRCYIEAFSSNSSYNLSVPYLIANESRTCGGTFMCEQIHSSDVLSQDCAVHRDVYYQPNQNFDNFFAAVNLVLKIVVNDNWPDDLDALLNAVGYQAIIFAVLMVTIGTWYCINLFLAILTTAYSERNDGDAESSEPSKKDRHVQADSELEAALFAEIDAIETSVQEAGNFTSHFGCFEFDPQEVTNSEQRKLLGAIEVSMARKSNKGAMIFGARRGFSYLDIFHDDINTAVPDALREPEDVEASKDDGEQAAENLNEVVDERSIFATRLGDDRHQFQKIIASIVSHRFWEGSVMLITVINVGALSADYYGISETLALSLNIVSLVCTGLFALDIALKVTAFGITTYWSFGMNRLDVILVVVSIPDIIASGGEGSAFSAVRVFRLFRLLRILKSVKSVQTLLLCVIHSFSAAALLSLLLFLFLYIYSILGMQMFNTWYNANQANPNVRDSFGTLWEAALACFIVVTGDNWTSRIFLDGVDTIPGKIQNVAFFVSLFIIGNYVFLNLFIAILLDSLSEMMEKVEQTELLMPNLILPALSRVHLVLKRKRSVAAVANADGTDDEALEEDLVLRQESKKAFHDHILDSEDNFMTTYFIRALEFLVEGELPRIAGSSLMIFAPTNVVRRGALWLVSRNGFNLLIDVVLLINVGTVAAQSPLLSDVEQARLSTVNLVLTVIFCVEMVLKVVAFGLMWPEGVLKKQMVAVDASPWKYHPAYLRIGWNVVDMIVVVTSIIGQVIPRFQFLRTFRTVRLVHRIPPMRTVVLSLLQALPQVMNAVILVLFLWVVFTIMGVQFFKGKFYYCSDPAVQAMVDCVGNYTTQVQDAFTLENVTAARQWLRLPFHFDNFGASLTTVFVVSVGDGWSGIMYNAMDTTTIGGGLQTYASPQYAIFFVIMYICTNFCALQMLVGVLINYFQKAKELNDGSAVLTPQQRLYVHARQAIEASAIVADEVVSQPYPISEWLHRLYTYRLPEFRLSQPLSEYILLITVVVNTIAIAYTYSGMSDKETTILNAINLACLILFTVEMGMRLIAYFPRQYFSVGWNVLDFCVIVVGWCDVGFPDLPGLTFLRVIRIVKLLRGTGVEKLIVTTIRSYQSFVNALLMLVLLLFVYAAIGVEVFGALEYVSPMDSNYNFRTVPNGMLVLFQIITTEGWENTMNACSEAGGAEIVFFVSFMLLGNYTTLQLFTAVVVDVFEQQTDETDRIIQQFETIRDMWIEAFGTNPIVHMSDFIVFSSKIPPSLSEMPVHPRRVDVVHFLASLAVPVTSTGMVQYHHFINALAWRRFNIEVRTIGGVIHGIVFDRIVHQSFTIGEAFCAEIVQSKWRDFVLRKRIGSHKFKMLEERCHSGVFALPRHRSVQNILTKDEIRSTQAANNTSSLEVEDLDECTENPGGDTVVPPRDKRQ